MRSEDWKIMGNIGIVLGLIFLACGAWIWLNVNFGWSALVQYYKYRGYSFPLFIIGIVLLFLGYVSKIRSIEQYLSKMRYLRIGYITVFFTPFLAIIIQLLMYLFLRFDNYDWLFEIMIQTEVNMSIIGVQMFGLILCLLGIKKGEVLRDFKVSNILLNILLILWGALVIFWFWGMYCMVLDWSRLPGVRNLTIWDYMEYATFMIEGLLWIASGIILIVTLS